MRFELLPNEIFLDLFDYFDGINLFYTFYGLNYRFNWLLYKQYRSFRFNFQSSSKQKFDIICQKHLPLIVDRVISFCLSDDDGTPQQINLFVSYMSSFEQFSHLRALSLLNIEAYTTVIKILDQCQYLRYLNYLKITSSYQSGSKTHYQSLIDRIWNLTDLIYCNFKFNVSFPSWNFTLLSAKISSTLEHLSLSGCTVQFNQINDLYKYTPCLKHISIEFNDSHEDFIPCLYPTLINLNVRFSRLLDISKLICVLQNMPNLYTLNMDLTSNMINGYQLEEVISKYLPKLKNFHLKMVAESSFYQNKERMNEIIEPFRSSFWIDEHHWFVWCFFSVSIIYLYTTHQTLPYYMNVFPDFFISTDPNDNLQNFANDITKITNEQYFNYPILSNIRLTNLKELRIPCFIPDQFWSIVPHLHRLHTLIVYVNSNTLPSEFRDLLNRTFYLHKLKIHNKGCPLWQPLTCLQDYQLKLLQATNASIHHLDLIHFGFVSTEQECLALTHSSLVHQCEILSIQVKSPEHILSLINNMTNLRVLNISWQDIKYSNDVSSFENNPDETIQWLKEHLPSTCFVSVEKTRPKIIRIWIA